MNASTLTTLAFRFAGLALAFRTWEALLSFWAAAFLADGPEGGSPHLPWPLLAGAAVTALAAAALLRLSPWLTARIAPQNPEGPGVAAGTLVAAGIAVMGAFTFLEGAVSIARLVVILQIQKAAAQPLGGLEELLVWEKPGLLFRFPGIQMVAGLALFLSARPLARWWADRQA